MSCAPYPLLIACVYPTGALEEIALLIVRANFEYRPSPLARELQRWRRREKPDPVIMGKRNPHVFWTGARIGQASQRRSQLLRQGHPVRSHWNNTISRYKGRQQAFRAARMLNGLESGGFQNSSSRTIQPHAQQGAQAGDGCNRTWRAISGPEKTLSLSRQDRVSRGEGPLERWQGSKVR